MSNPPLDAAAFVSNINPADPPGPESLTGRHVILERLEDHHYSELFENLGAHAEIWTWWPEGPFSTSSEFDEYLELLLQFSGVAIYAVIPVSGPNNGKASGLAFAMSEDHLTNRVAELGLFFGPQLQRTRAGTEVAYLLGDLLFSANHRRLQWKTNALNVQSRKAAERFGFVYEGTFRQHQINKGRNRDTAWYSIIDSEWPLCKKAFQLWLEDENFNEQERQRKKIEEIRAHLRFEGF